MMHESEFKDICLTYKELRKEGVHFPQRDPSEAHMIKFTGTKSPIFSTMENNRIYDDPSKTLNPMKNFKANNDYFSSPEYMEKQNAGVGRDTYTTPVYYQQQRQAEMEIKMKAQEDEQAEHGEITITPEEIMILKESCVLMDDIITNASHLNELRSEVAVDIIDNHTHSLKKLKRICTNNEIELPKEELNKLGIQYQTLKRQCQHFYQIVDEFKANNMKRPPNLNYAERKKMAIDSIEREAKKKQDQYAAENKQQEEPKKPPINEQIDLQGMDSPTHKPEQSNNNQEIDQLDMDFGVGNNNNNNQQVAQNLNINNMMQKPAPAQMQNNQMDLLGIDLLGDNTQDAKVDLDDDDFFNMLANRKNDGF